MKQKRHFWVTKVLTASARICHFLAEGTQKDGFVSDRRPGPICDLSWAFSSRRQQKGPGARGEKIQSTSLKDAMWESMHQKGAMSLNFAYFCIRVQK